MKNSQTSSIRPDRPLWRVYLALALITLASAALSLMLGPVSLSPGEVISAFFKSEAVTSADRIALYARLPRTCGCSVAGAALAVSGAGLAAAFCCAFLPGAYALVPFAAFLGALLSVLLVLLIAERTGASKITLVLGGVAMSSVLSAGVDAVVTFVPDALVGYSDFRIGSLSGLTMQKLAPAAWVVLAALALSFSLTHELDLLMLGRDTARSLGLRAGKMRILLLAVAAALAGAAVSFAGLLGFVGLIVPHIMRRLVGDESRLLLPGCAMGGAVMLLLCDLASRMLFRPYELPVGIALSFIGGPFFVWLLLRQRKGRTHD